MILTVYSKWIDGADKNQERGEIDAVFAVNRRKNTKKLLNTP